MGLFDSLPAPTKAKDAVAATLPGKRPADADASLNAERNKKPRDVQQSAAGSQARQPQQPACAALLQLEAACSEDKGSRLTMEDVAVISTDAGTEVTEGCRLAFFGVFDGHGGRNVAEFAAEHLHAGVLAAGLEAEAARLAAAASDAQQQQQQQQQVAANVKQCKAAIAEGFKELDRRALEQCTRAGWADGCTAVAVWVLGSTAFVANVGDARAVLARRPAAAATGGSAGEQQQQEQSGEHSQQQPAPSQEDHQQAPPPPQQPQQQQADEQQQQQGEPLKAITLTREHKAIFPQERQRIEKAGSFVSSDGRLAGRIEVSRAFGDRLFKKQGMSAVPDIQAFQVTPRDAFLLLACDGFWGVFGPQDAVDFAQHELHVKGHGAKQTCNRLIYEAIRERKCKDNCTVLLLRFGQQQQQQQ